MKEGNIQYVDMNASEAGTANYYKVRAYNYGGSSSWATVSIVIPAGAPNTPLGLNGVFSFASSCVILTWYDDANNEENFIIERKSEYMAVWEQIDVIGPNLTFYDDCSVDSDTFYQYRIRASNPNGYSSYSNIAHVYVPWF